MKRKILLSYLLSVIILTFIGVQAYSQVSGDNIKIMTYNIRYNNPDDGVNAWKNRKVKMTNLVKEMDPDIIGFQEALDDQVRALDSLMKTYHWFGVGRDDGKKKGEYAVIFFKKNEFTKIDSGYFWLSQTPEVPGSMGWDAACVRIVTWLRLRSLKTKTEFFIFNTHFDHIGVTTRKESAILLLSRIKSIAGNHSVILTGDFNSDMNSQAYQTITGADPAFSLKDTRKICKEKASGPDYSYTGFEPGKITPELIDFIFVRNVKLVIKSIISNKVVDGFYPSDHLPVMTEISL
ncbi:MAG: endonuclease/exonuclease/phosphatase family protein [Bacteroidia bacterium]|nr:endonuclease/exonuclease/phosphatase family protein [Bacteroidia bacterium]